MPANHDSKMNDLFRALGWQKLCHQGLAKKSIMTYGMTPEYLELLIV